MFCFSLFIFISIFVFIGLYLESPSFVIIKLHKPYPKPVTINPLISQLGEVVVIVTLPLVLPPYVNKLTLVL